MNNRFADNERPAFWQRGVRLEINWRFPTNVLNAFAQHSIYGLSLREFPCAIQDFGARAKEPHHVIPARHGR